MLVYLAAPYSDPDPTIVEDRMRNFCRMDANLARDGVATVSPLLKHLVLQYESLPSDWNYWKDYSETLLQKCDKMIVIMMEGWQDSTGVQAEICLCEKYNIPVEYVHPIEYIYEHYIME